MDTSNPIRDGLGLGCLGGFAILWALLTSGLGHDHSPWAYVTLALALSNAYLFRRKLGK